MPTIVYMGEGGGLILEIFVRTYYVDDSISAPKLWNIILNIEEKLEFLKWIWNNEME